MSKIIYKPGVHLIKKDIVESKLETILSELSKTSGFDGLTFLIADGDRDLTRQCKTMLEKKWKGQIKAFERLYFGIAKSTTLTAIAKKYETLVGNPHSNPTPNMAKLSQSMAYDIKTKSTNAERECTFSHVLGNGFDISIRDLADQLNRKNLRGDLGLTLEALINKIKTLGKMSGINFIDHGSGENYHLHGTLH